MPTAALQQFSLFGAVLLGIGIAFLINYYVGKKLLAKEIDALVKAYVSSAGYQEKGRFRSWLFKIAYNTFLNHRVSCRTIETLDDARTLVSPKTADEGFEHQDLYLAKRLDAVEFIHQHQEATIRRYKMAMIATFVVGIISGAITMAFILSMPADVPLFTFQVQTRYLLWFAENSRLIATIALALVMTFGMMSIISNVQDIMRMRKKITVNI